MARFLKADGQEKFVSPENGSDFSLKELQNFVGGYIEVIYLNDKMLMVVNENGKLQGLSPNLIATIIYNKFVGRDTVVGDVLVCDTKEIK